jgi:hypothetical protein
MAENLIIPEQIIHEGKKYTIVSIGDNAFYDCSGLTGTLIISDSVTSIGAEAFIGSNITELITGSGVSIINEATFSGCKSLIKADLANVETINQNAFSNASSLQKIVLPKIKTINSSAFNNANELSEIYIDFSTNRNGDSMNIDQIVDNTGSSQATNGKLVNTGESDEYKDD